MAGVQMVYGMSRFDIDIVNRLRFDAIRCEAQFSKGVAGNITEAADEIERLRSLLHIKSDIPCGPARDKEPELG